ncbi:MAG: protocatechuate 3,4-dioxygenase beta subunit [Rhodothermales bacterium]
MSNHQISSLNAQVTPMNSSLRTLVVLLFAVCCSAWTPAVAQDASGGVTGSGSISGTVRATVPELIPTVMIMAFPADSSAGGAASTYFAIPEPEGGYVFDGLEAGEYIVLARSPEFEVQFFDHADSQGNASVVTVADSAVTAGVDFDLVSFGVGTSALSGVVTSADDGLPIEGAWVVASRQSHRPSGHGYTFSARTNTNGEYQIADVAEGSYRVSSGAPGYQEQFFDHTARPADAAPVILLPDQETGAVDFALERAGSIAGRILDRDGEPLEGVFLEAFDLSSDSLGVAADSLFGGIGADGTVSPGRPLPPSTVGSPAGTVSGPDGLYRLDGLAAGEYLVRAVHFSGWLTVVWYDGVSAPSDATPVPVTPGEETPAVDFTFPVSGGFGMMSGFVTTADGAGVESAFVQAYLGCVPGPLALCPVVEMTVSGPHGRFEFPFLQAGDYYVSAGARGVWNYIERWFPGGVTAPEALPVTVLRDVPTDGIDIVLPQSPGSASLSGAVSSTDGAALAGARVWIESAVDPSGAFGNSPVQAWAMTDSTGAYAFPQIPPGTYTLGAAYGDGDRFGQIWYETSATHEQATPIVLVADEERSDVDLVVELNFLYGGIHGVVTDQETGAPIPGAFVRARAQTASITGAPTLYTEPFAVTDSIGQYRLERLSLGSYTISAHTGAGFNYFGGGWVSDLATPVRVEGGAAQEASFAVARRNDGDGRIEGRVLVDGNVYWADSSRTDVAPRLAVVEVRPTVAIQVWPESERFYTTVTARDGHYAVTGLPDGEYSVRAFSPGFMPEFFDDAFDASGATFVQVQGGLPTPGIDFALAPSMIMGADGLSRENGSSVHGQVVDEAGAPLADAVVFLMDEAGTAVASTVTTADGTYLFVGVVPGRYRVMVTKDGYQPGFSGDSGQLSGAAAVDVTAGDASSNVTLSSGTTTDVQPDASETPETFALRGNYPNPFNPATTLLIDLPDAAEVSVHVFDILGREVLLLPPSSHGSGSVSLRLDASGLASGVYLYRVQAKGAKGVQQAFGRMLLMK